MRQHISALVGVLFLLAFATAAPAADLPDFTTLAAKCGPAVVNVNTERQTAVTGPEDFFGEMFRNMPPGFERFFEQFHGRGKGKGKGEGKGTQKQKSLGSGFLISADGFIVTNDHVVRDADVINVTLDADGKEMTLPAKLIGSDEEMDLALLKIEAKKSLPYLTFGDSDALKVGEWLLAIGNPFGLDHTVTAGILSATGRNIHAGPFDNFLQTDASINPGNSGGPLLNTAGQVVGINTAIIASGQGIGFAIPSSTAKSIIDQIRGGKKVARGWLGIQILDVDENSAKAMGLEEAKGVLVGDVVENEPAAKAGIQAGDVVLSVDGKEVKDSATLLRTVAATPPGNLMVVTIWRDGRKQDVKVILGERAKGGSVAERARPGRKENESVLGISVRPLKEEERQELKISKAEGLMVVDVTDGKPAAEADIRPGDIVLKVNFKSVNSTDAMARIVNEEGTKRGAVMLQLQRRGENFTRAIPLKKK
jgi:serine protease Do